MITRDFKTNNFDLLRIFAATQVLLIHSFSHLDLSFPFWLKILANFPGVPMFFVMSGFLISASLERNASLKNYFKNRALRIYPGLWMCIILTVVVISVVGNINFFNSELPKWLLTQMIGIIYTPTFLSHYGFGSYNGSLWTIPIELQFYIVLPIVYFIIQLISKKEVNKTIFIFLTFFFFYGIYVLCFKALF